MTVRIYNSGEPKDVSSIYIYNSGFPQPVTAGFIRHEDQWKPVFGAVAPLIEQPQGTTIFDTYFDTTLTLYRGSDLSGTYTYELHKSINEDMSSSTVVKSGTLTGTTTTTTYLVPVPIYSNDSIVYYRLKVAYLGKIFYSNIASTHRYIPSITVGYPKITDATDTPITVAASGSTVRGRVYFSRDMFATGDDLRAPYSYTMQWYNNGGYIVGSTSVGTVGAGTGFYTTYTIPLEMTGTLSVYAKLENSGGYSEAYSTSITISSVPVLETSPSISPTSGYIEDTTLTCSTGTWTNSPTSYKYQWASTYPEGGGTFFDVSSQTSSTWTPAAQYAGFVIKCSVAASNDGGATWSSWASSSNTVTLTAKTPPSAPQSLSISSITYNTATASWTTPASNGGSAIIRYEYYLSWSGGNTGWVSNGMSTSVGLGLPYASASYSFSVRAVNAIGTGSPASTSFTSCPAPGCGPCSGTGAWTYGACTCGGYQSASRPGTQTCYDGSCGTYTLACTETTTVYTGCSCTISQSCGPWSACVNNSQSRTCTTIDQYCCQSAPYTQTQECDCCSSSSLQYVIGGFGAACSSGITTCSSGSGYGFGTAVSTPCGTIGYVPGGSPYSWVCCGVC